MINARSKRRRAGGIIGPGGCELTRDTGYVTLPSFSTCYANAPYWALGWPVTPPGTTRWGYGQLASTPAGTFAIPLVEVTDPIFPGFGGRGTAADGRSVLVHTFPGMFRRFGAFGLAAVGDIQLRVALVAVLELGTPYIRALVELVTANTRWVSVPATGWSLADYNFPDPGDPAPGDGITIWSSVGDRFTDCPTGYVITHTAGESTTATCPTAAAAPGWIDEPDPATTVDRPISGSGSVVWAV